jgi:tetratricopeptide (TPR) repeat protein
MTLKAQIFHGDPTKTEDYLLERQATKLKSDGDMDGAIECLKKAQALRGVLRAETRLAKYLQQAGRFDEAIEEIHQMLSDSNLWAEGNFGHQPRSVRRCQQASRMARLHADGALLCKREQLRDQFIEHEKEACRWRELHKKIKTLADHDMKCRSRSLSNDKGYSEYRPPYEYHPDGTVKKIPEIERIPFNTSEPVSN